MKEHMKYIVDHADEIEKLIKVKAQVSEVKSIMLENIDKVKCSSLTLLCLSAHLEKQQNHSPLLLPFTMMGMQKGITYFTMLP